MRITKMRLRKPKPHHLVAFIVLCCVIGAGVVLWSSSVEAREFGDRSLYIDSPAAGATVRYTLTLNYSLPPPVGSLRLQFCDTPLPTMVCDAPVGLDVQNAVLTSQTGETGFTISSQSQNEIIMTRTPQSPSQESVYVFDGIVNPSADSQVVFIRLASYSSTDATGVRINDGAVATMTTEDVEVYTQVPPILIFCVASVINNADCTDMTGNYTNLGELRPTQTSSFTTQMLARTNARSGYTIQVSGNTMTSGINAIPALSSPTASFTGVGQFGMNLTANANPNLGAVPTGPGTAAAINPAYSLADRYIFHSGDVLVTTTNPTRNRKFTISHIVNVPDNQPLGVYSTTITYVCIASF